MCVGIESGLTIEVNVRTGTVQNPGEVISSGSSVYVGPDALTWVHVNLDSPVTLTPGTTYVLELPDTAAFGWWGSCGEFVWEEDCPDIYPDGVSNSIYVGDFGFRTYTSALAPPQWGDLDCTGGGPSSVDALKVLRHVAALDVVRIEPCPVIGTGVQVTGAGEVTWGDVDCQGGVSSVDALKVLRFVAGMPAAVAPPCPALGDEAEIEP